MLTAAEREAEARAIKKEQGTPQQAPQPAQAAGEWESIARGYKKKVKKDKADCCYLCEAGRAFLRAATDYTTAHQPDAAREALNEAAKAYLECGDRCFEADDLLCSGSGYSQAELLYRRIQRDHAGWLLWPRRWFAANAEEKAKQGREQVKARQASIQTEENEKMKGR